MDERRGGRKLRTKRAAAAVLVACLAVMIATIAAGCSQDAEEEESGEIQLSFIAEEYVLTGEGEPFAEESRVLDTSGDDRYMVVLDALREPPEGMTTVLKEDYHIQSVRISLIGRTAMVDLASEGLSGGSMEEELLIAQIVRTLMLNFSNIASVQFTVDEKMTDTLMGHFGVDRPFTLEPYEDADGTIRYSVEVVENSGST
jgi:hypothetical protein